MEKGGTTESYNARKLGGNKKKPLLGHDKAEIDYRAEKVTFKDIANWKKSIGQVTDEEYEIIGGMNETGYIKNRKSYEINKAMREGTVNKLSEKVQNTIEVLKDVISRNKSVCDAVLIRKVDRDYIKNVYDIETDNLEEAVEKLNAKKLGDTYKEKAFVSTSYKADKNINKSDEVEIEILAPKGTNMFLTKNRTESEIILAPDTTFELEGAVLTEEGKIRLIMKVK